MFSKAKSETMIIQSQLQDQITTLTHEINKINPALEVC